MPDTTAEFALPYPLGTEPNNVPGDMKALAEASDDGLVLVDSAFSVLWARSATLSVPDGTATLIPWNTTTSTGSGYGVYWEQSAGVITILEDVVLDIDAAVEWASNAAGYRHIFLELNGVALQESARSQMAVNGIVTRQGSSLRLPCEANDTLELLGVQTSGGALNISSGTSLRLTRAGRPAA